MTLHVHCRTKFAIPSCFTLCISDRSQALVRGAWCKKKKIAKIVRGSLQTAKKFQAPPLLPWKLWVNPIEKHVNSIFTRKFVVICFRVPLTRVKNYKGPLFASGPPYKCLWTVPKAWISIIKYFTNCFLKMKCVVFACITAWLSFQDDLVHEKKFGTVPDRIKR